MDSGLLCHLLFGVRAEPVHGAAMLRFCCRAAPWHKLNMLHYRGLPAACATWLCETQRAGTWRTCGSWMRMVGVSRPLGRLCGSMWTCALQTELIQS